MLHHSRTLQRIRFSAIFLLPIQLMLCASLQAGTFVVKSAEDTGAHTLRWAITQANASPGADIITFNIEGNGPHTIMLRSGLPALTDHAGVIIDGLTQTGAGVGMTPPSSLAVMIQIDGTHAGEVPGIVVASSNNTIQGLAFLHFALEGIRLQATPAGTNDNTVQSCILGTTSNTSFAAANGLLGGKILPAGISLYSSTELPGDLRRNTIYSCIISGNNGEGVLLYGKGGSLTFNKIRNNFIGTDKSGKRILANTGNGVAMLGNCASNEISDNILSGNQLNGIRIAGMADPVLYAQRNMIRQNSIGIGVDQKPIGNGRDGINLGSNYNTEFSGFVRNNTITGNFISGNNRNGITVWEHPSSPDNADGNRMSNNSIYANRVIAVDLGDDGITMNDPGDEDTGANQQLNSPVILSAEYMGEVAIVTGALDVVENRNKLNVEVYRYRSNDSRNATGSLFLGSAPVSEDGSWTFSTADSFMEGDSIFAQMIDVDGNTSELCLPKAITMSQLAENTFPASAQFTSKPSVVSIVDIKTNPMFEDLEITVEVAYDTWAVVQVYTANAVLVETIFDRALKKGKHSIQWNGKNWKGDRVNPGWYVCIADADASRSERKFEVGDVSFGSLKP